VTSRSSCALGMVALSILAAPPAHAASLWGYSGLGLLPGGDVLRPGEYSTGARVAAFEGDGTVPVQVLVPMHLTVGLLEGLEATLLYPARNSGGSYISGSLALQLVKPTRENPTRVSLGLTNLGAPAVAAGVGKPASFVSANNLFMALSRDFNAPIGGQLRTLFVGYLGFTGAVTDITLVNLDSRAFCGLEIPIREYGSAYAEYLGASPRTGQFFNLGARYQVFPGFDVDAASLGQPGLAPWERAWTLGVSYRGQWPALLNASNQLVGKLGESAAPLPPLPVAPVPAAPPPKAKPAPAVAPPPAPRGTVYGRVTTTSGTPLPNAQVGLLELMQWRQTTHSGAYFVAAVPRGAYTLAVQDAGGRVIASRSVSVPGDGPIQADLAVQAAGQAASPGTLE